MAQGWRAGVLFLVGVAAIAWANVAATAPRIEEFPVPRGSRPHDVAPAPDGTVWYTAQPRGELGRLDPKSGATRHVALGAGSRPHGVIVGPDGAAWVTDGGLNAIVRVEPTTERLQVFPLPEGREGANLNTAAFDGAGRLWFTGQSGVYGRLDPATGTMDVWDAPRGRGPYGICATPGGDVYYVSLAGSFLAKVDLATGATTVLEPPTKNQGARRVWSDSKGRLWVSEWVAGNLALYDPASGRWREWKPPGRNPKPYSVYVDERDGVWLAEWAANAMVRFDPVRESFDVYPIPSRGANVRQMLGRQGEVWAAESGTDKLLVVRGITSR
ncbi:MAG: lyase [Candidatus Lambdaproteobacteria bacterium]|nr:lyase [Candidatus Lambdaproteobacteria bacterium]